MQRTINFNVNNFITILKNHKVVSSRREVLIRTALLQRKALIESDIKMHRRTGNFLPGGGGKLFAQKILTSCPNFYETVEKKRGPYDATT